MPYNKYKLCGRPLQYAPPHASWPFEGFPLELGIGTRGQKTRMMGLPDRERSLAISLQLSGYNAPTWHTDGQTDGHRATAKTTLRIASHG